jgi:ankyrin repeat protein
VKLLIAAGADVNLRNKKGRTALSWVSSVKRVKDMKESVDQDPSLDAETKARVIKLMEAKAQPPGELEKLLRAAGAKD